MCKIVNLHSKLHPNLSLRNLMFSQVSVVRGKRRGPHVTITYDSLDLTVQTLSMENCSNLFIRPHLSGTSPSPLILTPGSHRSTYKVGKRVVRIYWMLIGGSKGAPGTRSPLELQILSISCNFGGKNGQIIATSGKSCIRHWTAFLLQVWCSAILKEFIVLILQ